jgi:hypothetical protein
VITKENEITHVSFRKEEVNFYFGNIIVFWMFKVFVLKQKTNR